jgi:Fe-S cluster biogenesis protein NfuA
MRFLPGRPVLPFGQAVFDHRRDAEGAPLAQLLFAIDGVRGVTLETAAITVRKDSGVEWHVLKPPIFGVIMDYFEDSGAGAAHHAVPDEELHERVAAVLDEHVRPALAEQGGEVALHGVDCGVVALAVRGASLAAPLFALQVRIENTLKAYLGDINGVRFRAPELPPSGNGRAPGPPGAAARAIQKLLEDSVNPAVAAHGGRISLVDVHDGAAYIRLEGGCQGCGMSEVTLRHGVESAIKAAVPEITEVFDVTDHESGADPFYQPSGPGPVRP